MAAGAGAGAARAVAWARRGLAAAAGGGARVEVGGAGLRWGDPRAWGPGAGPGAAGGAGAGEGAVEVELVLRAPFAPAGAPPRALGDVVRALGDGSVALAASAVQPGPGAVVADVFERAGPGGVVWERRGLGSQGLAESLRGLGLRMRVRPDGALGGSADPGGRPRPPRMGRQSTNEFLMVAPTAMEFNAEAARDNAFMSPGDEGADGLRRRILAEFSGLHRVLTCDAGLRVHLFEHGPQHGTPDACFPNNWFSTHPAEEGPRGGGSCGPPPGPRLVTYPLAVPNRRPERRADILGFLRGLGRGYDELPLEDQEGTEEAGQGEAGRFLEGTGALVPDRVHGVVYAALSGRCDEGLVEEWAERLGYLKAVTFRATDAAGVPIYHTNVVMAVGTGAAVVCSEAVEDTGERRRLRQSLRKHHEVVEISRSQMGAFCGNVLEVEDGRGLPALAMSSRAHNAFLPEQRAALLRHCAALHHAPVDTLEDVGGGGVRCTLAEIF